MDKIAKALARLPKSERLAVRAILEKLAAGSLAGFDVKKLVSRQDIFRVSQGDIRIIFRRTKGGVIFILAIERRRESTYRHY
ncbi:MAG: hypothetical protein UX54_C0032G0003 [Parcubacteria group bacterium GW2011_GWA2_46_39]|nr:MAG: hypothetical protein UX54_C0032G0003 [Parcubacteria group bacterium GW2011_GWA2_46_39]